MVPGSISVLADADRVPRPAASACASPPGSAPPFQVQSLPSLVERKKTSVPVLPASLGAVRLAACPVTSQVPFPVKARLQRKKKLWPVGSLGRGTGSHVTPPSVLRNRPTSVAAITTRLSSGSTLMSVTVPAVREKVVPKTV